ncbi:MAG: glycerol-3-phosphate 1-O-acyltransferase PlsY [Gammaproteobacteria bacterium]|nr:glycerol-3-phosphate 1-O-acyltransferase PlsY [Gammaproteobacteria bacterium]
MPLPELTLSFYSLVCLAYLMGSLSTAIIVSRLMGLPDPRTQGSHNPGATNMLRIGGKKAAAITLFGDAIKGFIPVLIAQALQAPNVNLAVIGLTAFLGHLYPIFFAFKGGKGVATAIGVIVAISWQVSLALVATWAIVARLFKFSSMAALTAACLAPLFFWIIESDVALVLMSIIISIFLLFRHHNNIRNLINGTESKIR